MLDTHAVARSLTDAEFHAGPGRCHHDAVRQAAEHGDQVTSDQFKTGLAELRTEMAGQRAELTGQISELPGQIAEQRAEVAEVRTEIAPRGSPGVRPRTRGNCPIDPRGRARGTAIHGACRQRHNRPAVPRWLTSSSQDHYSRSRPYSGFGTPSSTWHARATEKRLCHGLLGETPGCLRYRPPTAT